MCRSVVVEAASGPSFCVIRCAGVRGGFGVLPDMEPWQPFAHQDLEQWLAAMAAEGGAQ
jgi:hypothetical protein